MSVAQGDIAFFTALVGDFRSDSKPYINFIATGGVQVPAAILKYAPQFATYTDDSYTTLLTNTDVDIEELKSFASELPWATRLEAAATVTDEESSATSEAGSDASEARSSISSALSEGSSAISAASTSAAALGSDGGSSDSSAGSGATIYAPMGIIAIAAIALL